MVIFVVMTELTGQLNLMRSLGRSADPLHYLVGNYIIIFAIAPEIDVVNIDIFICCKNFFLFHGSQPSIHHNFINRIIRKQTRLVFC